MAKNFLDENGLLHKRRPKTKTFTIPLERTAVAVDYYSDAELYAAKGGVLVFDLEIYPNYFLAAFQNFYSKKVVTFELFPGREVFDYQKLLWVMHNFCVVGFNSLKFDIPLIWLAMSGATVEQIQDACAAIIVGNARPRDIEQQYGFKMGHTNHIDLIEVAPLSASLKTYMGRLHAKRLQDLPYDPTVELTDAQAEDVKLYCVNDLDGTGLLLKGLCPQLDLRTAMSAQYGMDLRSKSDAQIAETVICSEVAKIKGHWPKRPKIMPGTSFKYQMPDFISYQTPLLQEMQEMVRGADFVIKDNGQVQMPPELDKFTVKIGSSVYRMGIGGLHSSEESVSYKATSDTMLIDRDVASYYPRIILNQGLSPTHMGDSFLAVYDGIVEQRLAAKKRVGEIKKELAVLRKQLTELDAELVLNTTEMNSKKLSINGSFGKLGSKYSNLYAPDLMFQVTISGQLCLLMLIEMIEEIGLSVVSGNTDGIVIRCPQERYEDLNGAISMWESITRFETEETRYKAVYSRDVNNYIAVKPDGKCKLKGAYSSPGLQKNPANTICVDAVLALITEGIPVEQTIRECQDITKFVTLRNVRGGGEKGGVYLGKVVRWYYAEKEYGTINYILSGNKVPKSDGARPLMDLPDEFPTDINYQRYIDETIAILYDIAYLKKPTQRRFF